MTPIIIYFNFLYDYMENIFMCNIAYLHVYSTGKTYFHDGNSIHMLETDSFVTYSTTDTVF